MASELRAELASADRVDLLCAFVMWPGLRLLENELRELALRRVPLRVITTTYLGGTTRDALDRLAQHYGADIRVQYEARRTRLHAKAWFFHRNTGEDTAYVGSSNLSRAALLDGIEWNIRLSRQGTPALLDKFEATFDSYWNSEQFQPYNPDTDGERLDDALAAARGSKSEPSGALSVSGLDVKPYPYQAAILEAVDAERSIHDRHRNLIVAATGTGKTVIAALDYRELCRRAGRRLRLLFVAHRQEILQQALRTYREVLRDGSFGELAVGAAHAQHWDQVFASIQGLGARGIEQIPAEHFDVVVVDEFHHAEAASYSRLLDHLHPRELLAMTATPERSDGTDVRVRWFGGRTAAELRLWDAINQGLLSPFHYFGVHDNTDLSAIRWTRGRYDDAELSELYTGNSARAAIVLEHVRDKVSDPRTMRALGFCVSVAHASYMAEVFTAAGLPARVLSGSSSDVERRDGLAALRDGKITTIFAADLLNEGVDVPSVDTVLFLRPTESATIFLQQLGRGLRLSADKEVLTVLDFVGHQHAGFRFDLRYRALTGATRRGLQQEVEHGFPTLPAGCGIVLDEVTQDAVLASVRGNLRVQWKQLVAELRQHPTVDLGSFLDQTGTELPQILSASGGGRSWTTLKREAGLLTTEQSDVERVLVRRVRALSHVDDPQRHAAYRSMLEEPAKAPGNPFESMLFFSLWPDAQRPDGRRFEKMAEAWQELEAEPEMREELRMVVDLGFDAARRTTPALGAAGLETVPLAVHASYQREEILAALGYTSLQRLPTSFMQGVLHTQVAGDSVDALFVTLKKSEAAFSPSTRYRDYAISPTLFHWESQSTTTLSSPTGRRYVDGTSTVLLFVRDEKQAELGTSPYNFLGVADHVSHQGEKPIAITWRLRLPMPAELFEAAAVAAS